MTPEEMGKSLGGLTSKVKHIEDAQIVQGVLERRIEDQIDSLRAAIESEFRAAEEIRRMAEATNRAADATLRATENLREVVASHEERLVGVEDRTASLEAAMRSLFDHMDRFIRGLKSNGHKQDNP